MVQKVKGRKGKIVPLGAMETWGTGGLAPIILNPGTRWKRLVSLTLKGLLYCRLLVILMGCGVWAALGCNVVGGGLVMLR